MSRWALAGAPVLALQVALGTLPLTGVATAAPLCEGLQSTYEWLCEGRARLSDRTAAACEALLRSDQALCDETDLVNVSPAAFGDVLVLLDEELTLRDLAPAAARLVLGHVVISPEDLDDPETIELLRTAYHIGKTVAIVNANQEEADEFDLIVTAFGGGASCEPDDGRWTIDFYGLQQSVTRDPADTYSYCVSHLEAASELARAWFRDRFSLTPPRRNSTDAAEDLPPIAASSTNLLDLATGKHCERLFQKGGFVGQIHSFSIAARDLTNQRDIYSFLSNYILHNEKSDPQYRLEYIWTFRNSIPATLFMTSPKTQTVTGSSYTDSISYTAGGSFGFSSKQGFSASVSGSVTIGESRTVTVPPIQIINRSNPASLLAIYDFVPNSGSIPPNSAFQPETQSLWFVPRASYTPHVTYVVIEQAIGDPLTSATLQCKLDLPFDAWSIEPPVISGVSQESAAPGNQIIITGTHFYPSLVTAVLLGGDPLDQANFNPLDNTEIAVTIPSGVAKGPASLQVNTNDGTRTLTSNTDITIEIN